MNRLLGQTGILALGTGTFAYLYHSRRSFGQVLAHVKDDAQELTTEICFPTLPEGRAKAPFEGSKEGPLVLQLQQVQVFFRHGARTPLYTLPYTPEVSYDAQLMVRDNQAIKFPICRTSSVSGCPVDWSNYDKSMLRKPLRGGALRGRLTTYGSEQMYLLGQRLRDCYATRLDLHNYDPKEVCILSSNVRRTVESARAVLAGMFGRDQLCDYTSVCGPVKIGITDPCYNILIPDTRSCDVLRKVNHSAMIHPDFIPGFQEQRLEVEEHMRKPRLKLIEAVEEVQARLDSTVQFYEQEGIRGRHMELNQHGDHYQHDPLLQPLYDERGRAAARVDRFWTNILNRDPVLMDIITADDMRALVYLRDIRVEEFEGTLTSGYRIHFYFDKNPYFWDTHIVKQVYTKVNPKAPPSRETPIKWKPCLSLVPEEDEEEEVMVEEKPEETDSDEEKKPKIRYAKPPSCVLPTVEEVIPMIIPKSFFHWLSRPTIHDRDPVTPALIGTIWKEPLTLMENEPKVRDPWDHKLNFVFARDDAVARIHHGWHYPKEVKRYSQMLEENAATIMYYAMTGQNECSRAIITRLSAGPLVTEMLEQAKKVACGQCFPKLIMYSSHDSTMTALLEAFGIWDNKWPPFGSDLRLEIYKEVCGCNFYVRLLYNGKEQRIRCQEESFMLWQDFCNALRKYVIRRDEHERICRSNILDRMAQEVLKHGKDEVETEEIKKESETPAGM